MMVDSEPAQAPVLFASGVTVQYREDCACAVSGADLTIRRGETISLEGPSGCGKTTLLRALAGTLRPTEGEIRRDGRAVLIYQDLRLVPEQSVLVNVCSGGMQSSGRITPTLSQQAEELLRDLDLSNLAHRRVSQLSGGQARRVAIARALMARPDLLLADEPLSGLDDISARRVLQLLRRLQDKYGFALVISSHEGNLLEGFVDRRVSMSEGCLLSSWVTQEGAAAPSVLSQPPSRWPSLLAWLVAFAVLGWALAGLELQRVQGESVAQFLGRFIPDRWADWVALPWGSLASALVETIQMAIVGTTLAILLSLPLAYLGSGVSRWARPNQPRSARRGSAWLGAGVREVLSVMRTVPALFLALMMVALVGLGSLAGVLALAIYGSGYLTKLFAEAFEDVDLGPRDALLGMGVGSGTAFRVAVWPRVRPVLVGHSLFVLEYNIRAASVLGVVGAGGIGQQIFTHFEWRQFESAMAGITLLVGVVIALDSLSRRVRKNLRLARVQ